VALGLSFDTTFLIDLQRERFSNGPDGFAHRFLERSPDAILFLSCVALGEFAEGFTSAEHPLVKMIRGQHVILPIDEEAALLYAGLTRSLRSRGLLIGANDLWICATSMRYRLPVVTADVAHFRRVEGLEVVAYRGDEAPR
jgi:tRNA(fMet)-specific endonuclease VapC